MSLTDALKVVGVAIDGGKDSLSMAAAVGEEVVKAPGMLTLTCYVTCPDVTLTVTPDAAPGLALLLVDIADGRRRLGASALAQVYNQLGDDVPDCDDLEMLAKAFDVTQKLLRARTLKAGHDVSDGGALTTVLEMAFAGNAGLDVSFPAGAGAHQGPLKALFAEELGLVVACAPADAAAVQAAYAAAGVPCAALGSTTAATRVRVRVGDAVVLEAEMTDLRDAWEATSFELEKRTRALPCVAAEQAGLKARSGITYALSFAPLPTPPLALAAASKPKVAILRQEGTNGDREMCSAFHLAGFEAWDVAVADVASGAVSLDAFRGVAFCGGFSFADVFGSAKGWCGAVRFNEALSKAFKDFKSREDTFSLGVCNGCQLMALMGWVPGGELAAEKQPRFIENTSRKFESRWSAVEIGPSPAVMLRGMQGSRLGVWVAHGEGRCHFPDPAVKAAVLAGDLAPIRYVDDSGAATEEYPFNPNGSPDGIAGLCSPDGRHLALMPHPERCFAPWQWPYLGEEGAKWETGPWLRMFQNAREWCA